MRLVRALEGAAAEQHRRAEHDQRTDHRRPQPLGRDQGEHQDRDHGADHGDRRGRARPAAAEHRLDRRRGVAVGGDEQPADQVREQADAAEQGQHGEEHPPQHRIGVGGPADGGTHAGEVPAGERPDQPVPGPEGGPSPAANDPNEPPAGPAPGTPAPGVPWPKPGPEPGPGGRTRAEPAGGRPAGRVRRPEPRPGARGRSPVRRWVPRRSPARRSGSCPRSGRRRSGSWPRSERGGRGGCRLGGRGGRAGVVGGGHARRAVRGRRNGVGGSAHTVILKRRPTARGRRAFGAGARPQRTRRRRRRRQRLVGVGGLVRHAVMVALRAGEAPPESTLTLTLKCRFRAAVSGPSHPRRVTIAA